MATLAELKTAINKILKDNFPGVRIHSSDTKEGFKRPAFFTQIVPVTSEYETTNFTSNKTMVVINYFSKDETEIENIKMYDDIKKAFGMALRVNQRSFILKNIRSEIVDEVLQFRFDLDYLVSVEKTDEYEPMGELDLEIKKE